MSQPEFSLQNTIPKVNNMSIKKEILKPFLYALLRLKNVNIDFSSNIDYRILKENKIHSDKMFPIMIRNSDIGCIDIGKGCKVFDSVCLGNVILERFVTLAGPGIKVYGGINGITIKSFCSIGANTVIQENNHNYKLPSTYFIIRNIVNKTKLCPQTVKEEISKGEIIIEEGVWIGSNCVILSGVKIGRGAIIGAGSVVTSNVDAYCIYCGNPARKIKKRFTDDTIELIENTRWWEYSEREIVENKDWFCKTLE